MAPETFREWLIRQAEGDPDSHMPYAALYEVLDAIPNGDIDMEALSADWPEERAKALVKAQKVFMIDQLVYAQDSTLAPPEPKAKVEVEPPGKPGKAVERSVSMTPVPVTDIEDLELEILPCGFRGKDGVVCGLPSVAGSSRCTFHGGAIGDPEVRRSLLIQAYGRAIEGADTAIQALIEVALDGRSEMARVQAAKELLDRVGMTVDAHPSLHEPVNTADERRDAAIEALRDKLEDTRTRLKLVSIPAHSEVVVNAEAS